MSTLEPFDLSKHCVKCKSSHSSMRACNSKNPMICSCFPNGSIEHMHITCDRCGYEWSSYCADYKQEPQNPMEKAASAIEQIVDVQNQLVKLHIDSDQDVKYFLAWLKQQSIECQNQFSVAFKKRYEAARSRMDNISIKCYNCKDKDVIYHLGETIYCENCMEVEKKNQEEFESLLDRLKEKKQKP